jgi:cyclopropane fatty-acyl-phospholipid synthase-like methyltransferase
MNARKDNSRWEELYREQEVETMPWYFPDLDPDFERALDEHAITTGKVLDLCTGPATQAMALAERGYEVFATDISETAVRQAREKAAAKGLMITFRQADILRDTFDEEFDLLVDRGCFHVFEPRQRPAYVKGVKSFLKPGGWLLLKCFSHKEKRRDGPYRFTPEQLGKYFKPSFEIISIVDAEFNGSLDEYPKTLFSVMRRK